MHIHEIRVLQCAAILACRRRCAERRRAAGRAHRRRRLRPAAVAPHRTRRQPRQRRRRRPWRPAGLLRRRGVGRHLQDHRRRRALGADLRRPAGRTRSARSPSRRPIRTSSGPAPASRASAATSRSATASTSRPTPARPGRTWASSRPAASRASSSIPTNPDIVFACALGHALRSAAGARRLPHDRRRQDLGARAVRRREHRLLGRSRWIRTNPRILFAGMWQLEINTWGRESGGPAAASSRRATAATTWTRLTGNGLPTRDVGKVDGRDRAVEPESRLRADRDRRRRAVERARRPSAGSSGARTTAARPGASVSYDRNAVGRTHYYSHVRRARQRERGVLPDRGVREVARRRPDARRSSTVRASPGGDHHDMWIDPTNANRMIVGQRSGRRRSRTTAAARGTASGCRSRRCTT